MKKYLLALGTLCAIASCKKDAGDGGNSSIKGRVEVITRLVIDNPGTSTDTLSAADRDVYIIYGDHISPDDRVRTNFDGEFEIKYLRPGDYTIYVFSDDTSGATNIGSDEFHHMVVKKEISISDKKQDVDAETFTVYEEI